MKYPSVCAGYLLSVLLLSGTSALAVPDSGQDSRIEWNLLTNWPTTGKTIDMVHSLDGKFVYLLNDKQAVQIFNSEGQLQGSIPVEDGVSSIDISPQGETLYLVNNKTQTFSSMAVSFTVEVDITGSPVRGPVDAPITIALFTDFECPYCKKIGPLLDQVLERNPQTVKLVLKNMPLTNIHQMAMPSAMAALAADKQGKFWEFHDRLFSSPTLTMEVINKIAQDLKLDITRFQQDMASPEIQAQINKDLLDAQKAGVTGTPTIIVNGRIPRQRSVEGIQSIIEEELEKKGKN